MRRSGCPSAWISGGAIWRVARSAGRLSSPSTPKGQGADRLGPIARERESPARRHPVRIPKPLVTAAGLAAFAVGCASGLPVASSSTSEKVAVEFNADDGISEAAALAREECGKLGKAAEFDKVDITASSNSRIVRYNCVSTQGG